MAAPIKSASSQTADGDLAHDGREHDANHKVDWQLSAPEPTRTPKKTPTPTPTPTVSAVAVSSDAGDDDTYVLGDVIQIRLTFSEPVDVTGDAAPQDRHGPRRLGREVGRRTTAAAAQPA